MKKEVACTDPHLPLFRCPPYAAYPLHEYSVIPSVFVVPDHHGNLPAARSHFVEPDSATLYRVAISGACSVIGNITAPLVVNGISLHRPEPLTLTTTGFRINIGPAGAER